MSDYTDSESSLSNANAHTNGRAHRRGLEPIPMFDEAQPVPLQFEILRESYDEILKIIAENGWELEEGLHTLLLTGLGYQDVGLRLERVNQAALNGDSTVPKQINEIVNDLASYHSMYSVLKYKAFKLYKVNQALEFNVAGLRATEQMWEGWADRMRREQADLKAEVIRLRSLMAEFKIDWDDGSAPEIFLHKPESEAETQTSSTNGLHDFGLSGEGNPPAQPGLSLWQRIKRRLFGD